MSDMIIRYEGKVKRLKAKNEALLDKIKMLGKNEESADEQETVISRMAEDIVYAVKLDEDTLDKICSRLYSLNYRRI